MRARHFVGGILMAVCVGSTGAPAVQAVRMLGPDVAVAWSEESSIGQIENGEPLGARHSHYLQVLHRTPAG